MLLAIDIGNTNVTVGAFGGVPKTASGQPFSESVSGGDRLLKLWRLATDVKKTADEYGVSLKAMSQEAGVEQVDAVIYGSVVPGLNPIFESAIRSYFGVSAQAVTYNSPLGIRIKADHPREVGVDRLLNALAVYRLYGGPAVVIDFGTATTFDCVSGRGDYLGGAILIGPKAAAEALAQRTAQLPQVEIRKPRRIIGTNTVDCIQAGLYYGYLGMVERILEGTLGEMSGGLARNRGNGRIKTPGIRVIATGGLAGLFAKDISKVQKVVPDLTLQGLRLAHLALMPAAHTVRKVGPKGT